MLDLDSVTVVLPTYNSSRYILPQIESILTQTKPPRRLLIVDDASADGTYDLIRTRFKGESIIELRQNPVNQGQDKTLEAMLTEVRTDFFAISDHDNVWLPEKLFRVRW